MEHQAGALRGRPRLGWSLRRCGCRGEKGLRRVTLTLDNALRAKLGNPVRIVSEDLTVDALVVLSQAGRGLIESSSGFGKTYRQSHGVNTIGGAVFRMNHRDRFLAGHNTRIMNGCFGIADFRSGNSGGVQL